MPAPLSSNCSANDHYPAGTTRPCPLCGAEMKLGPGSAQCARDHVFRITPDGRLGDRTAFERWREEVERRPQPRPPGSCPRCGSPMQRDRLGGVYRTRYYCSYVLPKPTKALCARCGELLDLIGPAGAVCSAGCRFGRDDAGQLEPLASGGAA